MALRVHIQHARAALAKVTVHAEIRADMAAEDFAWEYTYRRGTPDPAPEVGCSLDEAALAVEDISLRRPTLDEVFLALTGHTTAPLTPDRTATTEDAA